MDPRPEQTFFADPALDRLMGVVFTMAAELQVLRDRVATLEMTLERAGQLDRTALDTFEPDPHQATELAADSRAYVAHVLAPILHNQASRSDPE